MRVSVCRNALLGPGAAETPEELTLLGYGPEPAPHPLCYVDPIKNPYDRPRGEDPKGIELRRHPDMLLAENEKLWRVVDQFKVGVKRELGEDDYDQLSNWHIESIIVMSSAHHRDLERKSEALRKDGD